jgi:uncharacterized OB-fold protein
MPADELSDGKETVDYGTCPACGYVMLPVLPLSPCGHDDQPVLAPFTESGVVYSWTSVQSGIEESTTLAMADFLEGRLRITAPMIDSTEIAIGDRVRVTLGRDTPFGLYRVGN